MTLVRGFLIGVVASGAIVFVAAATLAAAVSSGSGSLHLAVGRVLLVGVDRAGDDVATSFGPGLVMVAAVGGVLNAVGAWVVGRRRGRGG